MARVKLNKKFQEYTGAVPPNESRFYLTKRYGRTIMSHCPLHRDPNSLTAAQRASNNDFAQARALADTELADETKREIWLQRWREHSLTSPKPYKTLRGFTIAQIRKQSL